MLSALVFTMTLAIAGCSLSSDDSFAGHWTCSAIDAGDGNIVDVSTLGKGEALGDDLMWMDLKSDGTAGVSTLGEIVSDEVEVTWTEIDSQTIEVATSEGESMLLQYNSEEETLVMNVQGQKVYFTKS